jgi:L-iditol 2-dehydrogenase
LGVTISCNEPPFLNGGMAEYEYISNNVFVYKIPKEIPDEHSVLVELLSFFFYKEVAGWTIVIQGTGSLGVCQVIKMKSQGAGKIIAIDQSPYRLDLASSFGADLCLNVSKTSREERIAKVREITRGYGADMVIECVGLPDVISEGIEMLRMGGHYIEMGNYVDMGATEINPHKHLCTKNINIRGISNHPYTAVDNTIKFIGKYGKEIPFEKVISHKFKLSDIKKAFETSMSINSMKVVILPNE